MGATRAEYEIALSLYRREQKELQAQVLRMLGASAETDMSPKEMRRRLAKQLKGISVSRMIIEAR